jgi:anti-sigma regulatory factor (Ser/Thr protein kinase)/biotin operon repressor
MAADRIDKEGVLTALAGNPQSTTELARHFGVTRQAVLHHLSGLKKLGLARQTGRARAARWEQVFTETFFWTLSESDDDGIAEHEMWAQVKASFPAEISDLSGETRDALEYAVTEMLNNAIDHSSGTSVSLSVLFDDTNVEVVVTDDGVGAFHHVQEHFDLPSEMDAIAHIAKGQQTTLPERHTGQGLFFTSRVVDTFEVAAGAHAWQVDNLRNDTAIAPSIIQRGTRVILRTALRGTRSPKMVFDMYADPADHKFDRANFRVSLIGSGTSFVSRSEAKRLAAGLESYEAVELDFANVATVGQGFVDELFRVWAAQHPDTTLSVTNASEEVAYMVNRGLPPRQ